MVCFNVGKVTCLLLGSPVQLLSSSKAKPQICMVRTHPTCTELDGGARKTLGEGLDSFSLSSLMACFPSMNLCCL